MTAFLATFAAAFLAGSCLLVSVGLLVAGAIAAYILFLAVFGEW